MEVKCTRRTSNEFGSIHDSFAYQKLKECVLGVITEKAAKFIKDNAKAAAKEKANSKRQDGDVVLQKHKWVLVKLKNRKNLSEDTQQYTFALPNRMKDSGSRYVPAYPH